MADADLAVGRVLSHYRIVRLLGSGGMGQVYLAEDTRLDRTAALKILPPELSSDKERLRRFVREAKAASAIDHPNIVQVYEIGQAEGLHFIAMQYVEGQTLHEAIGGRPLGTDALVDTALQITDAVAEAHARGIIHRDLKPANIMISGKKRVKLLDFGLARVEQLAASADDHQNPTMTLTEAGIVMGTVAYMSPEQALGKPIDARSDIFSLGVVLYEMATGAPPFSGRSSIEIIDCIVHNQPEAIARLNYDVPPEIERIVRKCLEKSPDDRYQSVSEILVDLKNLGRDLRSSDVSPSNASATAGSRRTTTMAVPPPDTVGVPGRRWRWTVAAVLLVAAAVAGVAVYRDRANAGGGAIRALAILPFKNVNLDPQSEYLSDGITDSIINNVSLIKQLRVMARGTVFTYKNQDVDPRRVGQELGVDGVVTGKLLQNGSSIVVTVDLVDARDGRQVWGRQYDRQLIDVLALQSEISREVSDELRINLTSTEQDLVARRYTENKEAYQAYLKGRYFLFQRTRAATLKAIDYFKQAAQEDPAYALAYDGLANGYTYLGITGALLDGLPPRQVMPMAKEAALRAMQLDRSRSEPHATLGHVHWNYDFDWEGTEQEYRTAIELNPNDSVTYIRQAFYLVSVGRWPEAREAIDKFRRLDPASFPGALLPVGIVAYFGRDYQRASEQLQKVTEMAPTFASPYFWLGAVYMEQGLKEESIAAFEHAVALSDRAPVALAGLGFGLARAGRTKEAEVIRDELLGASPGHYVPEFYVACLYGALKQKDEAFDWLNRAYSEHANGLSLIQVSPLVDDLRSDPRFSELLTRLRLSHP